VREVGRGNGMEERSLEQVNRKCPAILFPQTLHPQNLEILLIHYISLS